MNARSFCYVQARTKRSQTLTGGRTGAPVAKLACLMITPLYPLSNETIRTLDLNSAREMKEAFHIPVDPCAALPDVKERDVLVVDGEEYVIDWVGEWMDVRVPALHIVAQEVK